MTDTQQDPARRPSDSPLGSVGTIERPMGVGYGVIGAVLLLGAAGYVLDRAFDTSPWFLIGGLAAGIVIGLALLAASMKRRGDRRHA